MELRFKTANEAWTVLYDDLGRVLENHELLEFYTSKPRGRNCNETIDLTIRVDEPSNCLVWSKIRRLSPIYLAKECLWYQSGSRNPKDAPSKVWEGLANKSNPDKGLVNSNYGAYIFTQIDNKDLNKTVFEATIDLLKRDPDSRQAIWQIPIMSHRQDDDTPCTSSVQFLLRDGKLNCIVYMRSCDCWFGLANDISQFMIWQMMVAKELDVELGFYKHTFGSFHVYQENFIDDEESYNKIMDEEITEGKELIPFYKFYDERNYRIILDEILNDFNKLSTISKQDLFKDVVNNKNELLKNEELKYMLANMKVNNFIH